MGGDDDYEEPWLDRTWGKIFVVVCCFRGGFGQKNEHGNLSLVCNFL